MNFFNINKQLGLRHPKPVKLHDSFTNVDGITEYKAKVNTTAYKAQPWVYLNDPEKILKKGTVLMMLIGKGGDEIDESLYSGNLITVDANGKHGQGDFQPASLGKKTLFVPKDSIEQTAPGKFKVIKDTPAYVPQNIVVMSQPHGNYPADTKIFGYKAIFKADDNGMLGNRMFLATQLDGYNVFLPATDFTSMEYNKTND